MHPLGTYWKILIALQAAVSHAAINHPSKNFRLPCTKEKRSTAKHYIIFTHPGKRRALKNSAVIINGGIAKNPDKSRVETRSPAPLPRVK